MQKYHHFFFLFLFLALAFSSSAAAVQTNNFSGLYVFAGNVPVASSHTVADASDVTIIHTHPRVSVLYTAANGTVIFERQQQVGNVLVLPYIYDATLTILDENNNMLLKTTLHENTIDNVIKYVIAGGDDPLLVAFRLFASALSSVLLSILICYLIVIPFKKMHITRGLD